MYFTRKNIIEFLLNEIASDNASHAIWTVKFWSYISMCYVANWQCILQVCHLDCEMLFLHFIELCGNALSMYAIWIVKCLFYISM